MRLRFAWMFVAAAMLPVAHASADERGLVRCGNEQIAIFPDTTSKDGRFAIGWTIRSHAAHAPAPWSVYDPDNPVLARSMALLRDDQGAIRKGDVAAVDGLVDLRAKTFTAFRSDEPVFAGNAHDDFVVRWYEPHGAARFGVVINNHDGNSAQLTIDLWLVDASGAPRVVDLKPRADEAIHAFLKKRDPKDAAKYEWRCDVAAAHDVFTSNSLALTFVADVPDEPRDVDAGRIEFAVPSGDVTRSSPDAAARRALLHE